jgi:hypothetical protein
MPNYYIQARRSTFNPFSFDEYVKPLNMYKEYYEKNEEAITDMQEQANLWKNIMESEKDSKLAEKYNTYVNNLNNATQQLKNGMSYNLRNQIQQLRGQSAMVKQIENAYNLRARDIDAYNELMIKDPSRIGADDPTTRSLNDYLNGPVKNNYGVSGDALYKRAAEIGEAFSARHRSEPKYTDLGNGLYQTVEKAGYNNNDISLMLNNPNSELNQQINKMLSDINIPMSDNALQQARQTIAQGMISGIKYDQDISYNRYSKPTNDGNDNGNSETAVDSNGNSVDFNPIDWETEYASSSGFTILTGKKGSTKEHTGEKVVIRRDGSKKTLTRSGDMYFDGFDYYIPQKDGSGKIIYTDITSEDKKFFEELGVDFEEEGALSKYNEIMSGFINNNNAKPYIDGDEKGVPLPLPKDPSTQSFGRRFNNSGKWIDGKEPLNPDVLTCLEYKTSNNKTVYLIKLEDNTGSVIYKVDKDTYDIYKKYKEKNTSTNEIPQIPPLPKPPQDTTRIDSTKTDSTSIKHGDILNM